MAIRVARRSIRPYSPSKSDEVLEAAEARLGGLNLGRLRLQYPHNAGKQPIDAITSCLATLTVATIEQRI